MGEYTKVNSTKKTAKQLETHNPLNIPTYEVSCLRSNKKFSTIDKRRNRLCYECNVRNSGIARSKGSYVREN